MSTTPIPAQGIKPTATALDSIKAEADACPSVLGHWAGEDAGLRLVIWRPDNADVMLQVEPSPLGLRYVIYESNFGGTIPEHWSDTTCHALPLPIRVAYWWTYRHLWGWLTHRRWRGLPEALSRLDVATLRWEHEQQVQP